jgi:uncharacterized ion transporter superfamily protein YfcC
VRLRLPHPFVLLLGGVAVAAVLTWILPAGVYDRVPDAELGRDVVVAGTYHAVPAAPVGPFAALLAVPRGIVSGADVILTILFAGGAFALLDATGALGRLVGTLVGRARRPRATVVVVTLIFATFGAMENMHEEIIALVPVLVLLSRGLGFGAVTALSMSLGGAVVGSAFGPTNPFGTGIALRFAELAPLSGAGIRMLILGLAVTVWIAWTLANTARDDVRLDIAAGAVTPATRRDFLLLLIAVAPILVYVVGVLTAGWEFNQFSALFLVAGFAIGLVSGRTLGETTVDFIKGMETMLAAGLFVGVARGISVVLADGQVMDTIVAGLVAPLDQIPALAAAGLMIPVHALIHIPVASNSGHAVLTMPIMGPTADLLGFSRDAAVMAYQAGGMMMDMVTPTNGAMLAMLLKGGVSYSRWLRFAVPGMILVGIVGFIGIVLLR